MRLIDFFDRLYIIHLPERTDRYRSIKRELFHMGVDINGPKVYFPEPVYVSHSHGYPSIAYYCNFVRHLGILKNCLADGVDRVWILEDDAIFRRQLRKEKYQEQVIQQLAQDNWDMCFLGHAISEEDLQSRDKGLVPFDKAFICAHCYCINGRILSQLVAYLEETMVNSNDSPRGGKISIDGAYNLFRQFNPDVVCLVSNPNLSAQKGSPSSIAEVKWYEHAILLQPILSTARSLRDEAWRLRLV